jgi:cysteine-rich repeat protein
MDVHSLLRFPMKREIYFRHCSPGSLWLVILPLLLVACMEPASAICPSGRACPAGLKCAAKQDVCIKTDCGDGIIQDGEACDDGNIQDGDGCSEDCKSKEACGNGVLDRGEVCDDGDNESGDGCSADCRSKESCGNGIIDPGEQCDDEGESGKCNEDCTLAWCGDGMVNASAGEQCDDKGESSICNANCTVHRCGDGVVNYRAGEQCDDGDDDNNDGCVVGCMLAKCGDGYVQEGEACDKGGETGECDSDCTLPVCGDRILNRKAGEQCDEVSDFCVGNCLVSRCGDGILNIAMGEMCDSSSVGKCGVCDAGCLVAVPARAVGMIRAIGSGSYSNGETISIDDGGGVKIIEFNDGPCKVGAAKCVDIGNGNDKEMAKRIASAVDGIQNFKIDAFYSDDSAVVVLVHQEEGALRNLPVVESVDNKNFLVEGMSGGVGHDCARGDGCFQDKDCESGRCVNSKCQ